ncbi:hypothetical protein JCM8547_005595 [Rhodosporidiobolus lusitaniae]
MSTSSPAPPADLTTPASPPAPSSSDSAPPPSAPAPPPVPLPPRSYPSQSLILAPPPRYAPNSTVPTFLRVLAAACLLGGSVAAAVGWVYKNVVRPRLVIALQARVRLFATHEAAYGRLYEAVKGLVGSKGVERLGGKEAVEFRRKVREEKEKVGEGEGAEGAESAAAEGRTEQKEEQAQVPLQSAGEAAPSSGAEEGEENPSLPLPPTPLLLQPTLTTLSTLSTTLCTSTSIPHPSSSNPSNLVQPQGTLLRSLVTFNEYLDSETYALSTVHSYRGQGGYWGGNSGWQDKGSASGERKALQGVTGDFKAEIRALKGALLNRRNFTQPQAA